jgi:hypothetical protein
MINDIPTPRRPWSPRLAPMKKILLLLALGGLLAVAAKKFRTA